MEQEIKPEVESEQKSKQQQEKKKRSWLRKLLGIGVVIAVLFGYQQYKSNKVQKEVHDQMIKVLSKSMPWFNEDPYMKELFELAHPKAFDQSYTFGTRRRKARFDNVKYIESLYAIMSEKAKNDGKEKLAEKIRAYGIVMKALITEGD
ncbi:MAG: hypothetical protein AB1630_09940 [bacterium]